MKFICRNIIFIIINRDKILSHIVLYANAYMDRNLL